MKNACQEYAPPPYAKVNELVAVFSEFWMEEVQI
jgi:hypothetical protein